MPCRVTPQFLEALVPTARGTVIVITDRVLLVIVLVVILGRVELGGKSRAAGFARFTNRLLYKKYGHDEVPTTAGWT
jgi:hypothetical protein